MKHQPPFVRLGTTPWCFLCFSISCEISHRRACFAELCGPAMSYFFHLPSLRILLSKSLYQESLSQALLLNAQPKISTDSIGWDKNKQEDIWKSYALDRCCILLIVNRKIRIIGSKFQSELCARSKILCNWCWPICHEVKLHLKQGYFLLGEGHLSPQGEQEWTTDCRAIKL